MLTEHLGSIINLTILQIIALISPGPDFAIIVRNSLIYSRKTGLLTAIGIAFGIMIHVSYTLLGLGFIISQTAWLFECFKYIGASYLIYIGYKGLRAQKGALHLDPTNQNKDFSALAAFRSGFFTNALNPKAMLFFISLFSVFIAPSTPIPILITYGFIIFITTLLWFSFVALCLSGKSTRKFFSSISHWIERTTGGLLMLLGIKLFFIKK